jgi:hypothetical protein
MIKWQATTWPPRISLELSQLFKKERATDMLQLKKSDREWLLSDGSSYVWNRMTGDYHHVPPGGERQRLEATMRFHDAKAALYAKAFESLKKATLGLAAPFDWRERLLGPLPENLDARAVLQHLKDLHRRHVAALQDHQRTYGLLPEVKAEREAAARKQEQVERDRAMEENRRWETIQEIEALNL